LPATNFLRRIAGESWGPNDGKPGKALRTWQFANLPHLALEQTTLALGAVAVGDCHLRFKTLGEEMNRSRSFINLGILLLVSLLVSAQGPQDGVITINGGKDTVLMKPWSTTITPPEPL
jgi:hypothetical protein